MSIYNFFIGAKPVARVSRHILFWMIRIGYLVFIMRSRNFYTEQPLWSDWVGSLKIAFFVAVEEMVLVYTITYWLFPRYFSRKKYVSFSLLTFSFLVIVFVAMHPYQIQYIDINPNTIKNPLFVSWYYLLYFTGFTLSPCVLFMAVRLCKGYFEKMKVRETLSRENAELEFQLLKAQVHPHFLFNTLNNIYSFALDKSPKAGQMVAQLSDMMHYMIHDCEAPLLSLDKELKMMRDYVGLERARYGDRLDMQVDIRGDLHNKKIAPLLMIPFLENCFKHGASQVLERPRIRLQIVADDDTLDFRLRNSKPVLGTSLNRKNGIGLMNIKKRLQLLYHAQYELKIDSTPDTFSVHMRVPLEEEEPALN